MCQLFLFEFFNHLKENGCNANIEIFLELNSRYGVYKGFECIELVDRSGRSVMGNAKHMHDDNDIIETI